MIINGIITPETRLSDLNSGWDADKTVADLIKDFGCTCKYGEDEYVVITEPVLDNWGTNGEIDGVKTGGVAFYAYAIKLGDEHEHDTIYYPYTGNEYWCSVYELCWYVPDIAEDDDRYQMLLNGDYSEIVDWENVDKVTLC